MREDLDKFRLTHSIRLENFLETDLCDASLDSAINILKKLKEKHGGDAELDIYEDDGMVIINLVKYRTETDGEVLNRLNEERARIVRMIENAENSVRHGKERLAKYDAKFDRS